ncbi:MAG: NADH-quinone oxidoreductase subunit NuoG [candidate division Zixibacteria bacterium]|nr:NADH-quinone oxidoreductase subunit NuoG [candidate division Zixibacteria bacterium]
MATLYIDDKKFEVEEGKNLLETVLTLGFDLPYFCWHPALGSVGACRQCAVIQYKDKEDTMGKIVMACMEPVSDGMRISVEAEKAKQFRASVIEWLMVSHPHDCPICDEGGECHLQDMTVMSGHNYRRYKFKKVTFRNQELGPFINHEMNRCITCYRCVRFYRDFAGGDDLRDFGTADHVYFGREKDGILESEFSGNLVEVCPTGVFTDKTLKKHYARKWDLQGAPSICQHCGLGCNTIAGSRYGRLVRTLNRFNHDVNGYFICDRGRFGYEFTASPKRIRRPLKAREDTHVECSLAEAVDNASGMIDSGKAIGIGSPRASLESNYALRKLVGKENFYSGLKRTECSTLAKIYEVLTTRPVPTASMHQVERADAVLVLGEDLTNTAPMLDLAIRQAVRNQPMKKAEALKIPEFNDFALRELAQDEHGPLYIANPTATRLDGIATDVCQTAPDDIARLGFAIANVIDPKAPAVKDLAGDLKKMAEKIASDLQDADRPVIIGGTSQFNTAIIEAIANIAQALHAKNDQTKVCYTLPECNSLGASLFDTGPVEDIPEKAKSGNYETLVILENDIYRRLPHKTADELLSGFKNVIVLDYLENRAMPESSLVLPSASYAEGDGTLINNEGRAQRYFQVLDPHPMIHEGWRWIRDMLIKNGGDGATGWNSPDIIASEALNELLDIDKKIEVAPDPDYRIHGQKLPRASHRYSGRTAMKAHESVHELKPPEDLDSPMTFTMEGYRGPRPGSLNSIFWAPGWNSVQSVSKYQLEVGGKLRGGDPGIRLIEPSGKSEHVYFRDIPSQFAPKKDMLLAVPIYHIFGSEELSSDAAELSKLIPESYIALNNTEAKRLNAEDGALVKIIMNSETYSLKLKIVEKLPDGCAAIPFGLKNTRGIALPGEVKIEVAK